jgi:2-hydroxychromene-2-carboxylate isomerase
MAQPVEFFLFYGSIHTYLSVMRIERAAAAKGVPVRWRPFNLRAILIEQDNTAFARNPVRLAYNWRDIERRAKRFGIPFAGRPAYPVDPDLLALRIGVLAAAEGWCPDYTRATFKAWFLDGKPAGSTASVASVLGSLGRTVEETLAKARAPENDARLSEASDAARASGVFGSPSFLVGTELFWGDDRLEDALAFAAEA